MLCRKSGASRCGNCIFAEVKRFVGMAAQIFLQRAFCKLVKRFAERVAPVAQTTHPAQAGLARVLNSLVVPPFLRRGNECDQPHNWRSSKNSFIHFVETSFILRNNFAYATVLKVWKFSTYSWIYIHMGLY
jgi:hypothetical protein